MKLITLNIWGGIIYEPLVKFIKKHADDTDVFSFQEVLFGDKPQFTEMQKARENIFHEIELLLPGFVSYKHVAPTNYFAREPIEFEAGQAIFVKKTIKVKDNGGILCTDKVPPDSAKGGKMTGRLQWVDLEINNGTITITNLHGLWQEGTLKVDTPERLTQSKKIKEFLNNKNGKKILCGDFNLSPTGKSIEILEEGMVNLIKKYNIQSTRSSFYTKDVRLGDYILVSSDIEIKDFKVFQEDISDHLPLLVEFK